MEAKAIVIHEFFTHVADQQPTPHCVERQLFVVLLRIGHAAIEQFLVLQSDSDCGATTKHGDDAGERTVFCSQQPIRRPLRTIFGRHEFQACVYRHRSNPKTPIVLRPVDVRLGIGPYAWSPLLREFTMRLCIDQPFEPSAKTFDVMFGQTLSVDLLERVSQQMGSDAAEVLAAAEPPPTDEEGEFLIETADGKGVPMVRTNAARLRAFEDAALRSGKRRMATVANVYSVDRYVRSPEDIVSALPRDASPDAVHAPCPVPCHNRLVAEFPRVPDDIDKNEPISGRVLALTRTATEIQQRRKPRQSVVRLLMDGQHSLWGTAAACSLAKSDDDRAVPILDIIQLSSYVWRAAKALYLHRQPLEALASERLQRRPERGVKGVITGLRQMATRNRPAGSKRSDFDTVCGYSEGHAHRMEYNVYLSACCPIARSVIEDACRHLVQDRMERSGNQWTIKAARPFSTFEPSTDPPVGTPSGLSSDEKHSEDRPLHPIISLDRVRLSYAGERTPWRSLPLPVLCGLDLARIDRSGTVECLC